MRTDIEAAVIAAALGVFAGRAVTAQRIRVPSERHANPDAVPTTWT